MKSKPKSINRFQEGSRTYNYKKKDLIQICFLLTGDHSVSINIPYKASNQEIRDIVKSYNGTWNRDNKLWEVNKDHYSALFSQMMKYCQENQIVCQKIPEFVFQTFSLEPHQIEIKVQYYSNESTLKYTELQLLIDPQSLPFYEKLYDFQKQSLKFGIKKHGRLLLADEMGIGKTIQSLAIAYMFRFQWPLVVICPSTLRYNWNNEILNWYGEFIKKSQIQVYSKGGSNLRENTKILIISYDLAWKYKELIRQFKVAIVDEAHYLKNSGTKRTDILVPLLTAMRRVILLTGTPAFARPRQIYNLASIVRPDMFYHFRSFGQRYCEPERNPWSGQIEYNGCKNVQQLHYLLKNQIMMRRLKKDVLTQLPEKQRQKITIETNKGIAREITSLISSGEEGEVKIENMIMQMMGFEDGQGPEKEDKKDNRQKVMKAYQLTGMAKIEACKQYILSLLQNNVKLLIFAHHQVVLDDIQQAMKKNKHKFIRIDGKTPHADRQNLVQQFQSKKQIIAALLSISAAGVGLTLTASSTVVFAQLHWTPGMLIQAEDRAHRISQKNSVNCHYLIGQNTLDPILYNYLLKKINNVSTFVDGTEHHLEVEQIDKGKVGKFSKEQDSGEKQRYSSGKKIQEILLKPVQRRSSPPAFEIQNTDISEDISSLQEVESIKSRKKKIMSISEQQLMISSSRKFNRRKRNSVQEREVKEKKKEVEKEEKDEKDEKNSKGLERKSREIVEILMRIKKE